MKAPLGIFGGTFDPVHYGHLVPVQQTQHTLRIERVVFVPASEPPHRNKPVASSAHRLNMLRLALQAYPEFEVDTRELERNGPSFTVPTLESFRNEHPSRPLCLLLGLDAFLGLPSWHRWSEILNLAHITVMQRPGWTPPAVLPSWWAEALTDTLRRNSPAGSIVLVGVDPCTIQATVVRQRLYDELDVADALPPEVLGYVQRQRLYASVRTEMPNAI